MGKKDICGGCGEQERHCCCEQEARNAAGIWMNGLIALGCFIFIMLRVFKVI
jgi:hypothetical protein